MAFRTSVLALVLGSLCGQHSVEGKEGNTPLEIDNTPCKAENLMSQDRYLCAENGTIICQGGWAKKTPIDDPIFPCGVPICQEGCENGICEAPNLCNCKVGWTGVACDECVPLPGCQNGNCENAFECNCDDGWKGGYCEKAICNPECENGQCSEPNVCTCESGWSGQVCNQCHALPGCMNGECGSHPNTCECFDLWTGTLCDIPLCEPECVHGECVFIDLTATTSASTMCMCTTPGFTGTDCNTCIPYHECPNQSPGACEHPNDCLCFTDAHLADDNAAFCNTTAIREHRHY